MIGAFETILYEKRGPVAWISLNRPEKLNAFNNQMRDDLWEVLYAVDHDPEVRAMVLRGAGPKVFCAGADLTEFGTAPSQVVARRARWERDVFGRLLNLGKPAIAAVHGYVIGSGVELAALCDIRIAAADARFWMPETSLGLIPAAGGTQTLPRLVGRGRALHMVLTGAEFDASDALAMGLVTRVVPRGRLWAAADHLARRLAGVPAGAMRSAREALRAVWCLPLAEGLRAEERLAAKLTKGVIKLDPAARRKGRISTRWGLIVNVSVE